MLGAKFTCGCSLSNLPSWIHKVNFLLETQKKSLTKAKQDKQIIFNEGRRESSWRMNREKCSASSGNNIFPTIIKKVWHCLKLETVSLILKNRHGEPGLPVEFARQVGKSLEPVTW